MSKDNYKKFAKRYDKFFEPMNAGLRSIGIKLYPPQAGMAVLDVGCGTGIHLQRYLKAGCRVSGIDASPSMLEIARQRLGHEAALELGQASLMPWADGSFDLVLSMLMLHELDASVHAPIFGEIKRVLKKDGRILLVDFHPGPVRGLKGWFTKFVIFLSELAAGGEHFKNYRKFIAAKGLKALIEAQNLTVEQHKILSGGNMVIYLLKA